MIELTQEQRGLLKSGKAVSVSDAITEEPYVIMPREVYERVRHLIYDDSEWASEEMRLTLARSWAANGWDEPEMDEYDNYDEELARRCP